MYLEHVVKPETLRNIILFTRIKPYFDKHNQSEWACNKEFKHARKYPNKTPPCQKLPKVKVHSVKIPAQTGRPATCPINQRWGDLRYPPLPLRASHSSFSNATCAGAARSVSRLFCLDRRPRKQMVAWRCSRGDPRVTDSENCNRYGDDAHIQRERDRDRDWETYREWEREREREREKER